MPCEAIDSLTCDGEGTEVKDAGRQHGVGVGLEDDLGEALQLGLVRLCDDRHVDRAVIARVRS